jgi:serine/threonine protein kinase
MPDPTRSFDADPCPDDPCPDEVPSSRHSDTATTAGSTDLEGTTSPRNLPTGYDLGEEIGRGGMGVVYRARDRGLQREVAVKILLDRYAPNSTAANRFLEEARITGQLQHPGIPAVHQVGTLPDGRPYLAMKLIKGRTLHEILALAGADQSTIRKVDYLAIFEAICQAVSYAHAHGVIHRDLKPQNVMVGAFGEVQVMDWGLAKVLASASQQPAGNDSAHLDEIRSSRESSSSVTQAGSVLGTPAYMSPEQAAGEIDRIDTRTDVFSPGAILCVLLTGKTIYSGKDAEAVRIAAVRGQTAEALARLDACGAEPELVALCKRCLAFEPADRPAQASAVVAEVAAIRRAAEERARLAEMERARTEVRMAEQSKRRRVTLIATIGVSLVLLAGIVGTSLGLWRAETQRDLADRAYTLSRESLIEACDDLPAILNQAIFTREAQLRANAVLVDAVSKHLDTTAVQGLSGRAALALHMHAGDLLINSSLAKLKEKEIAAHFAEALAISNRLLLAGADQSTTGGGPDLAVTKGNHASVLLKLVTQDRNRNRTVDNVRATLPRLVEVERLQREVLAQPGQTKRTPAELRQSVAGTLLEIATSYRMLQDYNAAVAPCTEAVELYRPRDDDGPVNRYTRKRKSALANALFTLGQIHQSRQDDAAAEPALTEAVTLLTELVKEDPLDLPLRLTLARAARELGDYLLLRNRLDEAAKFYTQDVTTFREVLQTGEIISLRFELGDAYYRTATLALKRKDTKTAAEQYGRCRDLWREVAETSPSSRNKLALALVEARLGQHAVAAAPAGQVLGAPGRFSLADRMQAVCILALCAGAVTGDRPVADLPPEVAAKRKQYVTASLAGLSELIEKAGYKNVARLKTDPDLDPIRAEEGFQALVKKLEK